MPARVFSERLLHGRASTGTQTLTIPAERRAVARFISLCCFNATTPSFIGFWLGTVPVYFKSNPPTGFTLQADLRVVGYAGEDFKMIVDGVDVAWHVSGFMFTDV